MNIAAVIILYHPDTQHLTLMLKALRQVDWPVILVDNSPERLPVIADEANHYIHNPENAGIAEAQNQGIDKAIAEGAEAVLLLDQDSQLTGTFLNQLLDAYNTAATQFEKLACIGPQVLCEFDNKQVKARASKETYLTDKHILTRQIIASGMIINTLAYKRIGKKESALFIDGVDHEWCWRAKRHGYLVLKAANVIMPHRQGDGRHRLFGMNFKRGAPVRLYYQVRNVLILSRRGYVPVYWKCRHLTALPLRFLVNRWYFPQGKLRGGYMWQGLKDGLTGRTGKIQK